MKRFRFLNILFSVLAALILATGLSSVAPASSALPKPSSPFIDGFVLETDDVYGFEILRPASWISIDLGDRRGFLPGDLAGQPNRLMLAVTNFQTLSNAFAGKNGIIANYEMFRQDPSLEAWISKTEALWITDGIQFEKIDELPDATIYVVRPAPDQIHLIAYVVSQDKPIGVILYGFGTFDDLALLNNTGVMADFKTMVTSVTAHKSSLVPDVPEMNADLLTISPKSGPFNNDSGYRYVGVYTYRLRTNYYQAPPMVYWLYEYMYYGGPPEHDTWLYRTNITDDPPCACAYGASCSLYQHSIGKMASRETHIATDSYTANKVVDHLGTNTAHMMVFGDPYARICMWY